MPESPGKRLRRRPEAARSFEKAREIIRSLPALPPSIRYLDEYNDQYRSIPHPEASDQWEVRADTSTFRLTFFGCDRDEALLLKHVFYWAFSKKSPATIYFEFRGLLSLLHTQEEFWLFRAVERSPSEWSDFWTNYVVPSATLPQISFYKSLLYFLCDLALGDFGPSYRPLVHSLGYKHPDSYSAVQTGEAILTIAQERAIIKYLDDLTEVVNRDSESVTGEALTKACLLAYFYPNGVRPVQACRIDLSDLRIYTDEGKSPVVHITAYRAKKRGPNEKTPFTRRIKSDWAPLFVEYKRRRDHGPVWRNHRDSKGKLFTLPKAAMIQAIGDVIEEASGDRRTAIVLRHSAAQRMADAGASVEELAEFLGHSDVDTALVYFESTPAQAERINQALAVSPIYSRIPEIARTRTIDKSALLGLPADSQIAGMPHGIPITGIGACGIGQSVCIKNPILACYSCRKFLPVNDIDLHRQVLADLRSVVWHFFDEARGGLQSQAYTQLAQTLDRIQLVIEAIEASGSS